MPEVDWSKFTISGARSRPAAIAAVSAFFYFDEPIRQIAGRIADAIEAYTSYVGLDALTAYTAASGQWKVWSERILKKDLRHLRNFPVDHDGMHLDYDSGQVPGPFGIALLGSNFKEKYEVASANLLRFDFPHAWHIEHPIEEFLYFIENVLIQVRCESANIGFAFKSTEGSNAAARISVHHKLPRYLGFDPCYSDVRDKMRGHIFTAHWMNFISIKLVQALGGIDEVALQGCDIKELGSGILIRASRWPPIGDINRGAVDLGRVPDVARFLRPLRVHIEAFGEPTFDATKWLARFDALPSHPWENDLVS